MFRLLDVLSTTGSLLLSFIGVLLCLMGFFVLERRLGVSILDVLPNYDLALVEERMLDYGPEGRRLYAWSALTLDMLFPCCYISLAAGFTMRLAGDRSLRFLALTPFIAGLIDITENVQIWNMLLSFPQLSGEEVALASATTSLKHVLVAVMILGMLIVGLDFCRNRFD